MSKNYPEAIYQIALTRLPNIGAVVAKSLVEMMGSAGAIFQAKETTISKLEGIGNVRAASIKNFSDFAACEKELAFIEKYQVNMLFLGDPSYPKKLLQCVDAPTLLFYKGSADLNASRIISVIGTRTCTDYGKNLTEELIADLAEENITIVSGLAYGIDTIAHKAALKNHLPTIGVLGHGLDIIYPSGNSNLAKQMVKEGGGLLTEFISGTKPDKHNFPIRNRIVAALADATVVVETDIRGGSMITAHLASNYNRDVFAFPGRTHDVKSSGCNRLINQNTAALITGAGDLLTMMNWNPLPEKKKKIQRQLFIELTNEEKIIFDLLNQADQMAVDELYLKSGLSTSSTAGALLSLEIQHVVQSLPGKIYKII